MDIQSYKDILPIVTTILAFVSGNILAIIRQNKKQFQETFFDIKITAYREVIMSLGKFYSDVYSFLDEYQFFEGSKEEWEEQFKKSCGEYYDKAKSLEDLYFKHMVILPQGILDLLWEATQLSMALVTSHYHFKSDIPHNTYDKLWTLIADFGEQCRKDLSTNIINRSLNKRLINGLYPINIKRIKK